MEEPRIGVYICWCGTNIAKMVDVEAVSAEVGKLPHVVLAKNYKYMCSDPGQELIVKDIHGHQLNRVVVAACSPRIHELTFRKAVEKAGINPYLFEMANIREQDSWVHTDRTEATSKAIDLVVAAIRRVQFHEPLQKRSVNVDPATLIIGGGISGMVAALEIANAGKKVYLIEKTGRLGGHVIKFDLTFPHLSSARQMIRPILQRVENHPNIDVFLNTEIRDVTGYIGNFKTTIRINETESTELRFGNIIAAVGLKPFDPSKIEEYGYGKFPDVITSMEFEEMLGTGQVLTKYGKEPRNIAIIHCVGSRNKKYHEYCSRTCCMVALKFVHQIRASLPSANIFEIYADMRAYGKGHEEFYALTTHKQIIFLMYDQQERLPVISQADRNDNCNMVIRMNEKLSGESIEVPVDMVILMVNMEAHENVKEVVHAIGVSLCGNQFFIEKHPKLDPVATTTGGVYIVGTCQGPKDIPDSVSQARAAAARILATIATGSVAVEVTTASTNEKLCCGCQTCVKVCPYSAISYNEEKRSSEVNEVLCKGCGTCGSACPAGAITSKHFTDRQILAEIEGIMSMSFKGV
ncbi:MAG: CoB--CoM heterodisulfide reductase iron-sulfur subunit A family protein [Bacteroidales bacterium]|jgi:heterodisulfide reductase subunit A|nr:CoB--CoM heterodisulfide reductase iron-sulfur subunit A family protein [Bacteroidales bacterium]